MRMIRIGSLVLVLVVGILTVIGSGGGGGGPTAPVVPEVPASTYFGSVTPDVGPEWDNTLGLVTTDGRVSFFDTTKKEYMVATGTENKFSGTLFSMSGIAPLQGEITSVVGTSISGTFTSPLADGTLAFTADVLLSERGANRSKLDGTWEDLVYVGPPASIPTGDTTWVIQADGTFAMTSTSGCEANGSFSLIEPTKNEYGIDLTVTNCVGFDGAYTGIGLLTDVVGSGLTDNFLVFTFSNGPLGSAFALSKI